MPDGLSLAPGRRGRGQGSKVSVGIGPLWVGKDGARNLSDGQCLDDRGTPSD